VVLLTPLPPKKIGILEPFLNIPLKSPEITSIAWNFKDDYALVIGTFGFVVQRVVTFK